jgi:hypothetical protein
MPTLGMMAVVLTDQQLSMLVQSSGAAAIVKCADNNQRCQSLPSGREAGRHEDRRAAATAWAAACGFAAGYAAAGVHSRELAAFASAGPSNATESPPLPPAPLAALLFHRATRTVQ